MNELEKKLIPYQIQFNLILMKIIVDLLRRNYIYPLDESHCKMIEKKYRTISFLFI
ncbi:hypothetical protein [Blattabacterium cuenoti]|uniref:hypothetical protein n=1 Tax=Blattabacterium cuenoti TaxID=1653831 RepID=UPI00163B6945|nr:hypothetical protein [Blattabacterium cuenoti]